MDVEPDDTITTSSEIDKNNADGQHPDSPMQQSPDQSDYNENFRSPESVNSVPLDEDIDETEKQVESDTEDVEQIENQEVGFLDEKMEVSKSDESEDENEASAGGIDEMEAKSDVSEGENEASVAADLENINNAEENVGVADTSSALIDGNSAGAEEGSCVSQSNLSTNEVSSTSRGEKFEIPDDQHQNADNSLDDVSDADSNDFKPNDTLDDVSDENSDDFNDESNVSQSDMCTSAHDTNKESEESVTDTTEANNSDITVQTSENLGISVSTYSRTNQGESHIESSDSFNSNQCLKENVNTKHDNEDLSVIVSDSDSKQQTEQTEVDSEESSAIQKDSETNEVENKENLTEVCCEILLDIFFQFLCYSYVVISCERTCGKGSN